MTKTSIPFVKMHGLGNSYIYIDTHQHPIPEKEITPLAIEVSKTTTGIGSDGLILICPSKVATVKMRIFNKDGSEAQNCGNGLRCVAKFAYEEGYASSNAMTIETLSGIVHATVHPNHDVSVDMGMPRLGRHQIPMQGSAKAQIVNEPFTIDGKQLSLTAVSMGNPHAVFFISDQTFPHAVWGPKIEKDPRFPQGTNVEFVYVESPTTLHCRVWERGSGITQACGTGACAVVVAAILNGYSQYDQEIAVHLEGGILTVRWTQQKQVLMTGPAETIATGCIFR